jgi:hypothetical protein
MVKLVSANVEVGVPLITHVVALIVSPAGSVGEALHPEIAAPLLLRVVGETDIAVPTEPVAPVAPT